MSTPNTNAEIAATNITTTLNGLREKLDAAINQPATISLGTPVIKTDIKSTVGPFHTRPEYETHYPTNVVQALGELYTEYNMAFKPLVEANREWETDYRFCTDNDGNPVNYFVQIDMVGLPQDFLEVAGDSSAEELKEVLRGRIFEIENSLAMYQLLQRIFSPEGQPDSHFNYQFRKALEGIRNKFGKKIALLAVTEPKHEAMRQSEFGKQQGEVLTDEEVMDMSGFDKFFGPAEFKEYIEEMKANGKECEYLFYVRSSDPLSKLKDPTASVDNPILDDPELRRIVKEYSLTFNIDNPIWPIDDPRRINDTKEYLPTIGMAHFITNDADLLNEHALTHLAKGRPLSELDISILSPGLANYLLNHGIDTQQVEKGNKSLRVKPAKGTYGGYGHNSSKITNSKFRSDVRAAMKKRGVHVLQHEMEVPTITDNSNNQPYGYIDRNFMSFINGPEFMGGFRSLMPITSVEYNRGRVHGNSDTVWAPISNGAK